MSDPTKENRAMHADTIIRNHVIWSMGAGLIPVLVADIFAVSALQLDMIRQMCRVYDVNFSETQGKAIVTSLTSSTLARIGAGSLVKLIPGIGSILGGVTVSVFAGASTYALGEVFKKHFESGGTILDFDPARLRKMYKEKFEKGKKVAEEWRRDAKATAEAEEAAKEREQEAEAPTPDPEDKAKKGKAILDRLKELAELRDQGILDQDEFDRMKKKLIDSFDS
ncbi:MAG: DUF697 domain-containing protein [Phaeodactylibacter sp.]|nr:DUF697 domain-containing protein [Phaeodactylibacter sp.]